MDLLITDMQMPDPDGVTVINEARRMQPEIFTLVITGHAAQYPLAELLVAGTADVMFKPFHMNELRARLVLTERRMRLIGSMRQQQEDLQEVSRSMISGLGRTNWVRRDGSCRPGGTADPAPPRTRPRTTSLG